jgi:type IV secretion system protein VirB10
MEDNDPADGGYTETNSAGGMSEQPGMEGPQEPEWEGPQEPEPEPEWEDRPEPENNPPGGQQEETAALPKRNPREVISGKPRGNVSAKQNKTFILGSALAVFLIFTLSALFFPALFKPARKETPAEKQNAAAVQSADYSALVPPKKKTEPPALYEMLYEPEADEPLPPLPPTPEPVRKADPPPQVQARAQPSAAPPPSSRPDTRYDSLQSKTISGIKGLTPTQSRYADGTPVSLAGRTQTQAADDNPYAQFGLPPKDQYLQQLLALQGNQSAGTGSAPALTSAAQNLSAQRSGGFADSYAAQNDQSGKTLFYQQGRENAGSGQWLPQASIWQGTIFEATLTSDINTDLPGEAAAMTAKNVYSSLDGKFLLIPQNSRLFGTYNSSVSYSQSRIQVGWHTLIRPDGYAVNLGNMQASDARGAAGLPGIINDHPFQYIKALFLISAFRIAGTELSVSAADADPDNQYVQNLYADTQNIINTFSGKIIDRALDVQPTITVKAGTKINIAANNTLLLPPLEPYPVTQPYHR